jgi:hypothetical protein
MDTEKARAIVDGLSIQDQDALRAAHLRYMHFTGVFTGDVSDEQIVQDRKAFPHLLKCDAEGRPSISDQRCADFMVALTGLSRELCLAWDEVDFIETHGEDFFETQLKQQESDRLAREAGEK